LKKTKSSKKARSAYKVEDNSDEDATVWSTLVPLVHTPGAKHILLKKQPPVVQDVIHGAIRKVTEDIFFCKTWPEEDSRTRYGKTVLLEACDDDELAATHKTSLSEVKRLLEEDSKFRKALCDLVSCIALSIALT